MTSDRPFGYHTLKLRAVFVPEGNPDEIATADITAMLGHDAVKIPAVMIPDGSDIPPPGYLYDLVLRCAWDADGGIELLDPGQGGAGSGEWAGSPIQEGTGGAGGAPSGPPAARVMPPTPVLAQAPRYADPAKTAVATWRRQASPRASQANKGISQAAAKPPSGTKDTAGDEGRAPGWMQDTVQQVRSGTPGTAGDDGQASGPVQDAVPQVRSNETPIGRSQSESNGIPAVADAPARADSRQAGGASPFTRDGSIPDMTPVPLLDGEGKPVFHIDEDEGGKTVEFIRPAGIDPQFFIARGEASVPNDETGGYLFGKLARDLPKFRQGGEWDIQRLGGSHTEFTDYSTIAIGLYGAAAGIPEKGLLAIQNVYASRRSNFGKAKMDPTYTHLAERNVKNTHLGYELYRSFHAKTGSEKP